MVSESHLIYEHQELTSKIIGAAIEVHKTLGGPGLLESVYEEALAFELAQLNLTVVRQLYVPLHYKGQILSTQLKLDLVVENKVIVECKSVIQYNKIFEAQLITYLRLTGLKTGLVINFGENLLKDGIHRVYNRLIN